MIRKSVAIVLVVVIVLMGVPAHSGATTDMSPPDELKDCDTHFSVEGYTHHGVTMFTVTHDDKPVEGADVYLNGKFYGTTGKDGKVGMYDRPELSTLDYTLIIVDGKHASEIEMERSSPLMPHKQKCEK